MSSIWKNWPEQLPQLTTSKTVSDASFKKRKVRVISPLAWTQLYACLFHCLDLLEKMSDSPREVDFDEGKLCMHSFSHDKRLQLFDQVQLFTGIMETNMQAVTGKWPSERPDLETMNGKDLADLTRAVLEHTKKYVVLLSDSIDDAAESEESENYTEELEELEERHAQLEQLAFDPKDTMEDVLVLFQQCGLEF